MNKKIETACIIDDDQLYVFGTKRVMSLVNFCEEVIVYEHGLAAIEGIQQRIINSESLPDVILLDLNMPVMDEWEFLEELNKVEFDKKVVIYIVSSSVDPIDTEKAKKYESVKRYLLKPITSHEMSDLKEQLLQDF
ncbi:MAG: response regulator [Flavobacteriales bacterium]|nr:response regulator [Flavobacteriales bacterium]